MFHFKFLSFLDQLKYIVLILEMSKICFQSFYKLFKIDEVDNFDYYFSDITAVLQFYGLDFWDEDWKMRKVSRCVIPMVLMSFYVFEPFYILNHREGFDRLLQALLPAVPAATFIVKCLMMVKHRSELTSLINQIREDFWNNKLDGSAKRKLLHRESRFMMLFVRFYFVQLVLCVSVFCIQPIIAMIVNHKFSTPLKIPLPGEF